MSTDATAITADTENRTPRPFEFDDVIVSAASPRRRAPHLPEFGSSSVPEQ
ncbi:hypothetical protein NE236_09395 [Actinoallomurus purpureus]|uniref:hypothetical protein n=1 Tax=Actinoallomurus purpureus TaxID=478114 RepID=UPI002092D397|nr:hypothetical protein [Actinoallomurus purpureus]MCO6005198.1 hypothetical protein [Actinoallomurus purpureus]